MAGNGNIKQSHSGNGDNIAEDNKINQSRNINISGNTQVTASGISQGDNQATITKDIPQDKNNSPQQQESKLTKTLAIIAAIATIIALFFNGIFNSEVKQWFDNLFDKNIPSISKPEQN